MWYHGSRFGKGRYIYMGMEKENEEKKKSTERTITINIGPAAIISVLAVPVVLLTSLLISNKKKS